MKKGKVEEVVGGGDNERKGGPWVITWVLLVGNRGQN